MHRLHGLMGTRTPTVSSALCWKKSSEADRVDWTEGVGTSASFSQGLATRRTRCVHCPVFDAALDFLDLFHYHQRHSKFLRCRGSQPACLYVPAACVDVVELAYTFRYRLS